MRILLPLLLIAVLAGLTVWMLKGGDDPDGARGTDDGPTASLEVTLARERVAAMVAATDYAAARRVLAPLVAGPQAALGDLVTAAVVELKDGDAQAAAGFVARARETDADAAAVQYLAGRLAELTPDGTQAAIAHYRRANRLAPDDLPTRYLLGMNLEYLGDDQAIDEAFGWYESVEAVGIEQGGPWFVSAIYRLSQLHQFYGEDPAAERRYVDLWAALQRQGLRAVKAVELAEGELARVRPPAAIGNLASAAVTPPAYDRHSTILPELGGGEELLAADLTGDRQADLVAAGTNGIVVALRTKDGGWRILRVTHEPAHLVRAIDIFQDDSIDLVYFSGASLRLLECSGPFGEETWTPTPLVLPSLPSRPTDMELTDFDHDGDLDLFVVGDFGGRLLRNDGAGALGEPTDPAGTGDPQRPGGFVDAGRAAGLPTGGDWVWCASEDFDGDQDVDLLMGGPGLVWAGSSLRSGAFEDVSATLFGDEPLDSEPLLADFDGDARMDALVPGSPARLLLQDRDGRVLGEDANFDLPANARAIEVDLDLDGTLDALWASPGRAARGALALSLEQQTTVDFGQHAGTGPLLIVDLESGYGERLDWELLRLEPDGVHVFRTQSPLGNAVRLRFRGQKDNRQGIGAVVELRAGALYRRHFWRGTSTLYGLGPAGFFDVVRITWPNGVIGYEQDLERGNQILEGTAGFGIQEEGLVGSCPFLYTWNGETYEFISDVLGITPLGLRMAPGMFVAPDHDEYVLVRGEQLVPKDGRLILQFTEELREVTYLDRIRLDVVDHPADTELFPNERFCFPPFPEARSHVVRPIAPLRVTGSDGADWTAALAAIDDVHAAPFAPLDSLQFQGLAEPHWL
ncbi:MAG: VCBS repeat-containing protein, partial [Planctomycetota bacterium]